MDSKEQEHQEITIITKHTLPDKPPELHYTTLTMSHNYQLHFTSISTLFHAYSSPPYILYPAAQQAVNHIASY